MISARLNSASFRVGWVTAISVVLAFGYGSPAVAQFRGCPVDQFRCLDQLIFQYCTEPLATAASCDALAGDLEAQRGVSPTSEIGATLGGVYFQLANKADNEREAARYIERSRERLIDVIARDENAYEAYGWLSVVDADDVDARLRWSRRMAALEPSYSNFIRLFGSVTELGTSETYPEAFSDAIDMARAAYDVASPGRDKWLLAYLIHRRYASANGLDVDASGSVRADEFFALVAEDSDWARVLGVLDEPGRQPGATAGALETACQLIPLFGEDPCLQGIAASVVAATRFPDSPDAQTLADAVATGVMTAETGSELRGMNPIYREAWRPRFVAWLDELVAEELDSVAVLDAIGNTTFDLDRRYLIRAELVERNPDDGQARVQLGIQLYNRDEWEAAIEQFERAGELIPPDGEYFWLVPEYLRQAAYHLETSN